jgi:hypothetical protein
MAAELLVYFSVNPAWLGVATRAGVAIATYFRKRRRVVTRETQRGKLVCSCQML